MSEPWEAMINLDQVRRLYALGIAKHGGLQGPPQHGCVERSLGAAYYAEIYQDPPASTAGLIFAAGALFFLAMNHCFPDGNKRVAWASMVDVLAGLGLTLEVSTEEAEEFVLLVADGKRELPAVIEWIAERLAALDPALR